MTLPKTRKKTQELGQFFGHKRVSARAKTLLWLSYVRPVLEYGCEVWTPTAAEQKQLESVQTQTGVKIFKLNEKTNGFAVRAMMHVTSLELRRTRATLKYYVKLLSMPLDRLVRNVVYTPRLHEARRGLEGKEAYTHWIPRTRRLLENPRAQGGR